MKLVQQVQAKKDEKKKVSEAEKAYDMAAAHFHEDEELDQMYNN